MLIYEGLTTISDIVCTFVVVQLADNLTVDLDNFS